MIRRVAVALLLAGVVTAIAPIRKAHAIICVCDAAPASATDVIFQLAGTYASPTGSPPFAAAPFTLDATVPAAVRPEYGASEPFFVPGSYAYTNNGTTVSFGSTGPGSGGGLLFGGSGPSTTQHVQVQAFNIDGGFFSLSGGASSPLYTYDSATNIVTFNPGTYALSNASAGFTPLAALDPNTPITGGTLTISPAAAVPEPSSLGLLLAALGAGLFGITAARRRPRITAG